MFTRFHVLRGMLSFEVNQFYVTLQMLIYLPRALHALHEDQPNWQLGTSHGHLKHQGLFSDTPEPCDTAEPPLEDFCHRRPPVCENNIFLSGPTGQYIIYWLGLSLETTCRKTISV